MVKLHEYKSHIATAAMLITSRGYGTRKDKFLVQFDHNPNAHSAQESQTKICSRCGESKPATTEYFRLSKKYTDGFYSWCKLCAAEHNRIWRANNKERRLEYQRAYNEANKEKIVAYYEANKEKWAERSRIYCENNKEANRAKRHLYRARQRAAEGSHTKEDIQRQYKAQKGKCYYCKCEVGDKYHADHVVPLSRGGSNGPENIVIACQPCNQSKFNRLPHEWAQGGRLL